MKNERGSAILFVLFVMPLIIAGASIAYAGAMSLRVVEQTNLICREGLLKAQEHLIGNLDRIVALNPTAKLLRAAEQGSKLTLAIPFYGPLTAVSVQEARTIFHGVQLAAIQSTNVKFKAEVNSVRSQLASTRAFGADHFVEAQAIMVPALALTATPKLNLTPDYQSQARLL